MSGLEPFWDTFNDPSTIHWAVYGDSTSEGNIGPTNGGWVEQVRVLADNRWQRGGDGLHPLNRDSWTLTTSPNAWTKATSSNAWDCGPMNGSLGSVAASTYLANGASKIATWTKPSAVTAATFTIYVVDGASAGNFSYSLDGGSNWTDVSETWAANNTIKRVRIPAPVTSTLKVRAANAAGTATNVYLVGGEPHTTNNGFVIHNLAANSEFQFNVVRGGTGNWHAFLDLVQPALVSIMFTNDALLFDPSIFEDELIELADTVTGYGGAVLFMNYFEQDRSPENLASMRQITKNVAAASGMPVVDLYDAVGGGFEVADGLGYMADALHPSDAGAVFIAQQVWPVIARPDLAARFVDAA
jgi:lysophospholipase L1-like esterase